MKFHEVYDLLKAGKYVTRELWAPSKSYLIWLAGSEYFFIVSRTDKTEGKGYALTVADMDACDWKELCWEEIVEAGKPEVVVVANAA